MRAVAIVASGSGGQASVMLDACHAAGVPVAGIIVADGSSNLERLKAPILGGPECLACTDFLREHAIGLGGGDAEFRRRFALQVLERRGELATVVHPAATISASAFLGAGSLLAAGAVVGPNARIGRFCIINTCASVDHDDVLEDGVNLSPGVHLAGTVTCREDCFLGIGASVVPGVTIGRRSIVGAGATVIANVPDDVTVVGTPARPTRRQAASQP